MKSTKLDKSTDPRYIYNPSTRRYVLKRNAIGRRVEQMMSRGEYCEHIKKHATDQMLKQRDLIKSDLSDERLADILRKLVDLKIDEAIAQRQLVPNKPPQLKRTKKSKVSQKGSKATAGGLRSKTKRRFIVKPPPPQETTATETEVPTETDVYSDSDISD